MMKYLSTLVLLVAVAFPAWAEAPSVLFEGDTYKLGFTHGGEGYGINAYLRPGEAPDKWTKMLALHHYTLAEELSPKELATSLGEAMRSLNPDAAYSIVSKSSGAVVLDYLTWTDTAPLLAEYNALYLQEGKTPTEIIGYQFGYREYGKITDETKDVVEQKKDRWRKRITQVKFPPFVTPK